MNATLTVILRDSSRHELARVSWSGEASFLWNDDTSLGIINDIDFCSYDVFGQGDMAAILIGLDKIRSSLSPSDVSTFDVVIALARRCKETNRSTLTFTPFGSRNSE